MKKINYLYLFIALATTTFSICSLVKEHNVFAFIGWGFAAVGYFTLTFGDRKMRKDISTRHLRSFIKTFGRIVTNDETCEYIELMMDDHFCINFENEEYYIPENSMLYTEHDEKMRNHLEEHFGI